VWVTSFVGESVSRLDPGSLEITLKQQVGSGPTSVMSVFGSVWVANNIDGTVSRLDPATGGVDATIPVGDGPNALAAAAGSVWVANEYDGSVTEIAPTSNTVAHTVPVGASLASLAAVGDRLWLAVGASPTEHRGGTLTVASAGGMSPSIDPAVAYEPLIVQVLSITNDGLLGYKTVGGADGATLVPDLATALPEVSSDGLTYRFTLRQGIRYSTGEMVRPEDVRHALERSISLSVDFAALFGAIDGAKACHADPATCDLADSIVIDEDTVTFRLARPDPDFPYKLAFPAAYPVPSGTEMADRGWDPVPATGPYMIAHVDSRNMELVRNPAFREWSVAAQPDGFVDVIRWRFGVDVDRAFDQLERGQIDWMTDAPASDDLESLRAAHPDQVVALPAAQTFYLGYDLHTPPFDDIRVRQAVNYAIDRDRVLELGGGPSTVHLTCQIFPPNFQGYEPFCPYTADPGSGSWTAPDLQRARALIDAADARGQEVTVWRTDLEGVPGFKQTPPYVVGLLDELGLQARLRTVRQGKYFRSIYEGQSKVYVFAWGADYPLASGFIDVLFQCGRPQNVSGFCSPSLDAAMAVARDLQAANPAAANRAWTEIEHRLVEKAVWVPLLNPITPFAFSERVGNIQVHPQDQVLLSRLWVR
jgi:peptide/nickel transport system substrate-binding protein